MNVVTVVTSNFLSVLNCLLTMELEILPLMSYNMYMYHSLPGGIALLCTFVHMCNGKYGNLVL